MAVREPQAASPGRVSGKERSKVYTAILQNYVSNLNILVLFSRYKFMILLKFKLYSGSQTNNNVAHICNRFLVQKDKQKTAKEKLAVRHTEQNINVIHRQECAFPGINVTIQRLIDEILHSK